MGLVQLYGIPGRSAYKQKNAAGSCHFNSPPIPFITLTLIIILDTFLMLYALLPPDLTHTIPHLLWNA